MGTPWNLRGVAVRKPVRVMIFFTNFQIAKAFMVPEFIVRHVRNVHFKNLSYLGVSYQMNSLIDKEIKQGNQ